MFFTGSYRCKKAQKTTCKMHS